MDQFLGEVRLFPWSFAPRNWALCEGQLMSIQQNAALFSLLGTMYGGNGQTNFGLPDLRGRTPVHRGNNFVQGEMEGSETVTINVNTMAAHSHALLGLNVAGDKANPNTFTLSNIKTGSPQTQFYYGSTNPVSLNPTSVAPVGSGQAHNNLQPYLTLNYCIALNGIFPSRG
jgi:microcystin-dependent protein